MRRLRWWRDRARPVVLAGLALYTLGFFMDWPFAIESSWILRWLGAVVVVIGAACGLLWLVDDSRDTRI